MRWLKTAPRVWRGRRARGDACGVSEDISFGRSAAKAIRRVRRHLEISQEEVGARCGVSAKHVGEIERGNKDPRLSTFAAVVERGLGMDLVEFMRVCDRYRTSDRASDLGGINLPEPIGHINRRREWMPR